MSDKMIYRLCPNPHPSRAKALYAVANAPDGYLVTIQPPKRSLEANAKMWCLLKDVADQVDWYGRKLTSSDWKDILTASFRKQDAVPNVDGTGFVVLGMRTSQMSVREMNCLIEVISAFGAEKGVKWSELEEPNAR